MARREPGTDRDAVGQLDGTRLDGPGALDRTAPPELLEAEREREREPVSAEQLYEWGTVYRLTEPEELMDVALDVARRITTKKRRVVRAAKHGLNEIDPFDLARNYRLEQGFTYELNLYGDGSKAREEFVKGERTVTR